MKKFFLILLVFSTCAWVSAQQNLSPTQINVFKNGTYFIVKEGMVDVKNYNSDLLVPMQPLLGTYWISTTKEVKINKILFITDTIKKMKPVTCISDLMYANKNKKVKITYRYDDKNVKELSGTLSDYNKDTYLAKIKTNDNKTTYIQTSNILEFVVEDNPVEKMNVDSLARLAKIEFGKANDNVKLKLIYMQGGIQWIPSYIIKVINDKELQLEMKALVENYSEAIDNAELTLTVGNPQFFYGRKADPLSYNYLSDIFKSSTIISALDNNLSNVQYQSYNNMNTVSGFGNTGIIDEPINEYSNFNTEGEKTNDLFMYKIGKVSMPKNSKTTFPVFSANFTYKDVYEVTIGDVTNYAYYKYVGGDPEKKFDVFHSFKITNSGVNPFTTAPVFVLNENLQPLAQDQLKYTAIGGDVSVQLSKALDVIVKNTEEEIEKTDNVKKVGKTYYSKVKIKGTIQIVNLQNKKMQLNVTKNLTADINSASDNGKITKSGKYYGLNPYAEINWELPLSPGEKKTITYQYEVFVAF
jgi:hypothetical protein